jgi:hypothetical protein
MDTIIIQTFLLVGSLVLFSIILTSSIVIGRAIVIKVNEYTNNISKKRNLIHMPRNNVYPMDLYDENGENDENGEDICNEKYI